MDIQKINQDKNLFASGWLPLITVYDDNLFVRNDYDVLSLGQRNYLIQYFQKVGFRQTSGRVLSQDAVRIHLPRPNSNLAVSSYQTEFLHNNGKDFYCVTPTMLAEALFYLSLEGTDLDLLAELKALISKCPFNIEWLRDISYRSDIEAVTAQTFEELTHFQKRTVEEKFKMKKAL